MAETINETIKQADMPRHGSCPGPKPIGIIAYMPDGTTRRFSGIRNAAEVLHISVEKLKELIESGEAYYPMSSNYNRSLLGQ